MPAAPRTPEKPAQRPKRSRYGSDFKKMASRKLLGQMQGLRNWCTTPSNKISPDGNGSKMSICSLKTYRSNEVLVYLYFGFLHREKGRDAVKLQLRDVTVQGCQAYMEHLRACGGKANYVANVGKVLARVMHYMDCTAGTRKPKTETHAPQKVASLARQMKVAMLRQDVDHDGLALPDVRALQLFYSKLEESAMGMLKVVIRETKAIRKMPNEPQALLELALNVLSADSLTREQAWLLQAAALMCLAGGRGLPPLRSSALSLLKCNKAAQSRCTNTDCQDPSCSGNRVVHEIGPAGKKVARILLPHHKTYLGGKGGNAHRFNVALRGVHALLLWCVEKYARPALLGCKEDTQGFLFLTKTGKAFQPSNFAPWFHGLVEEYGEGLLGNVCPQQIRHIWVRFLRQKEEQDSQHMQLMSRNGSGGKIVLGFVGPLAEKSARTSRKLHRVTQSGMQPNYYCPS
ncbi:hypothetical protein DUNSADRAFT_18676 [Dunaliella salina]|uniref:Uncharacterized protein n=1 Tax=Dunaliella salina TaxID=3046 RepID=A0ABQ7FZQ8_DUNSA|nr:hypothetical protein DUNSADRAFT_18676 [Dunaliella salina]|eukprot:KAF5827834.1 hypothetical protein DUNSADRAFT_18676 [Dunaliella salina]